MKAYLLRSFINSSFVLAFLQNKCAFSSSGSVRRMCYFLNDFHKMGRQSFDLIYGKSLMASIFALTASVRVISVSLHFVAVFELV